MSDRRFLIPSLEQPLPFLIESIGFNPNQENVARSQGYPYYHWLQTVNGEGHITIDGISFHIGSNSGFLLRPNVAHTYKKSSSHWSTLYVTFTGLHIKSILSSLHLDRSACYEWEESAGITESLKQMLTEVHSEHDLTGLDSTSNLYRFLTLLKKHGRMNRQPSLSLAMEKVAPIIKRMEDKYAHPELGLDELADTIGVSRKYVNVLFKKAFGVSAYAYLILLRIQKAKEKMVDESSVTIKEIAVQVGFRSDSHFVATFRRLERMTPQQFRRLHVSEHHKKP